jgi:hypothetical protein
MRNLLFNFFALIFLCLPAESKDRFDIKRSLRIDLAINASLKSSEFKISSVCIEPTGGTGIFRGMNTTHGQFRYSLYSAGDDMLIYSDGFSSLFEEWKSSEYEGKDSACFQHSIAIPLPLENVRLEIECRNQSGGFDKVLTHQIDIAKLKPVQPSIKTSVKQIVNNGAAHTKVDVAIIAEGYTLAEKAKFEDDAARFAQYFLSTEPFSHNASSFNINSVFAPSEESGCTMPGKNIFTKTILGASFDTFGSERYLETLNGFAVGDYVSSVAHDLIVVLVNSAEYGGGGVFNHFAIGSAHNRQSMPVMIHEIGHTFAGLADEYYDSEVPYSDIHPLSVEPWEPNITTKVDFASKWESRLGEEGIGLVEGGGYAAKGIFRSNERCMMKMLADPFCKVCREAIVARIQLLTASH